MNSTVALITILSASPRIALNVYQGCSQSLLVLKSNVNCVHNSYTCTIKANTLTTRLSPAFQGDKRLMM